jgi:hypothetical protein
MRYLLRRALLAALVAALLPLLAACGGGAERAAPAPRDAAAPAPRDAATPARAPQAAELVNYQRNGGLAATLDTVIVRADGATRSDKRYGGAGRRYDDFRLSAPVMARLRAALRRLPARAPAVGDGVRLGATYLLRYRGRTYVAKEGAVPAALRPAVATLDAIADGGGRSGRVHHVTQAPT